jgi:hypothetical protein
MKYIDFIGQALLLVATLVLTAVFFGTGILLGQFLLGMWQLLSSFISVLTNAPFRKKKLIHLVSSCIYLAGLAIIYSNKIFASSAAAVVLMMVPAWILALYYFSITWTWALAETKKSKFLPNISF